jgi:hypothetical protein
MPRLLSDLLCHRAAWCVALLLVACAGGPQAGATLDADNAALARSGSPYRWQITRGADGAPVRSRVVIGEPAPTRAEEPMQRRILASIAQAEATCGASVPPELAETRAISHSEAQVEEAWVVKRGSARIAYLITLELGADADFFVRGRCD